VKDPPNVVANTKNPDPRIASGRTLDDRALWTFSDHEPHELWTRFPCLDYPPDEVVHMFPGLKRGDGHRDHS
jgi:hypothetical protein